MHFAGMTLTIRDDARREIQADVDALTRSPKYFQIKAERAKTYFPFIEKAFEQERLPEDFKYLALQESALVPDAVSTSNAVGFWQFKDFTAVEMGLRVDGDIDERMNIASASRAAAKYLKQCNHYFNNWVYALQSYQMGAGGVMRMVGDKDLGSRHMEITSETYWYVKKFLAHKVAFEEVGGKPALEVTVIRDAGGKSLADLAREKSVEEQSLREFNKWLKTDRVPEDRDYVVLLPNGNATPGFGVLSVASTVSTASKPLPSTQAPSMKKINGINAIQARPGENLSALVARTEISISRFLNFNEMDIDKPVTAGSWYFLEKKKKHGEQEVYVAHEGEDVWTVSQLFGIRMKFVLKYNELESASENLSGRTVYLAYHKPGTLAAAADSAIVALNTEDKFEWDVSLAPTRAHPEKAASKPDQLAENTPAPVALSGSVSPQGARPESLHVVRPSDTLYSVARQYGVTIREIMDWNDKKDFNLAVGEKLRVAGR